MSGIADTFPQLNTPPDAPEAVVAKAARVELIVMDVDGVLTDGRAWQLDNGEQFLSFSVQDALSLTLCGQVGIKLAVISGRDLPAVRLRLERFPVAELCLGCIHKEPALRGICERLGVPLANTAYIGDDLIDLPLMSIVGLPVAVSNAAPEVLQAAAWCTGRPGGEGAVRELITLVLKARGLYVVAVENYLREH